MLLNWTQLTTIYLKGLISLNDHHNLALHVFLANDAYNLDEKVLSQG
jgi:hypothetical protein